MFVRCKDQCEGQIKVPHKDRVSGEIRVIADCPDNWGFIVIGILGGSVLIYTTCGAVRCSVASTSPNSPHRVNAVQIRLIFAVSQVFKMGRAGLLPDEPSAGIPVRYSARCI